MIYRENSQREFQEMMIWKGKAQCELQEMMIKDEKRTRAFKMMQEADHWKIKILLAIVFILIGVIVYVIMMN
ncbi:unnamed protein product [Rotaria magnacalcarata]